MPAPPLGAPVTWYVPAADAVQLQCAKPGEYPSVATSGVFMYQS
jgi:hypothetical protein